MRTGRPKTTLTISSVERAHLFSITRLRSLAVALTLRAKIVLAYEPSPTMPSQRCGLALAPIRQDAQRQTRTMRR